MSELTAILQKRLSTKDDHFVHFGRWFSTSEFKTDVLKVQQLLNETGISLGKRIMLADGNSYAFLVTHIALLTAGITIVPVNPQMPVPELRKVMARSNAIGAFIDPSLEDAMAMTPSEPDLLGMEPLSSVCRLLVSVHDENDRFELHRIRTERGPAAHAQSGSNDLYQPSILPQIPEDAGAIIMFTSGTTGTPKGVELTHGQVMATIHHVVDSHRLTPEDISYCFLPLFHVNAQVIAFLSTLYSGGKLVVGEKFSASRFWDTVREFRVTWVSAVPTVIAILVKAQDAKPAPPSLRFVRSASAPLPAFQAHRFESLFGVPVIESYGMTEAASQICVNPLPPGKRKIGSVGVPFGLDLRIIDAEGKSLPAGEIGEIAIRGDSVITKYASGDDNGKSFNDGWFHTGDVGYKDPEGYVFITGRSKEMINRAGQKISPREVEEVIAKHALVHSVAVIGLPDPVYGERVVAYLIPEEGRSFTTTELAQFKEELRELCRQNLSSYKCPVEYFLVDAIPVGPTGKIQRHRLRQEVLAAGRA